MDLVNVFPADAIEAVLEDWEKGEKYSSLDFPAVCDKAIVIGAIAENQIKDDKRVLLLEFSDEEARTASDELSYWAVLDSVLETTDSSSIGSPVPVTVGSLQSFDDGTRIKEFPSNYFDAIIADEPSDCLSDDYQRIFDHFSDANVLVITDSASVDLKDSNDFRRACNSNSHEYSLIQAMLDGCLSPVKAAKLPIEIDISNVSDTNGDFDSDDVDHVLEDYLPQLVAEISKRCKGRSTVLFTPSSSSLEKICPMLNEAGLSTAIITNATTNISDILADFHDGKYDILCSSVLPNEYWNCPDIDCVITLDPTKIKKHYLQMVECGMLLCPEKRDLLLLEPVWTTECSDLCRASSLICKSELNALNADQYITSNMNGVDLISVYKNLSSECYEIWSDSLNNQRSRMNRRSSGNVDPFDYAVSIGSKDLINYVPHSEWEKNPPTEDQLIFLEQSGIDTYHVKNIGYASMLVDTLLSRRDDNLTTPKQIRCLEQYCFQRVCDWKRDDASRVISMLARNHWKVPRKIDPSVYRPEDDDE